MITNKGVAMLPQWIKRCYNFLIRKNVSSKLIFIVISLMATVWFLIRVIPKPSRATYPCMQVIAPVMSSFFIWIITVTGSWLAFRNARQRYFQARYIATAGFLIIGMVFIVALFTNQLPFAKASETEIWYKPNVPYGEGRGIFPGRVAWTHNPKIASWDMKTGNWWEDKYVNQSETDKLLKADLLQLTGAGDGEKAWGALFLYFNKKKLGVTKGYQNTERIAIKINQNNTYSHENSPEINATPQLVLSVLKSLINDARVPAKNITVFDASRFITNNIYDKCHNAFPDVIFEDHTGGDGRVKAEYKYDAIPYSVDNGNLAKGITKCAVRAHYIIDMALLKGHVGNGTTLCAKNFYGATSIESDWHKNSHTNFDHDRSGGYKYIVFTDFLGHKDLGEKTVLFILDGIYGNKFVAGPPVAKLKMTPFNNSWPNSLFLSQDGVAIDAVGTDFILNEWPDAPDVKYCDMYLKESALANNPPSGTVYDPERDGTRLPSLGVFEHWNNSIDKQYSRNLRTGNGIELLYKLIP